MDIEEIDAEARKIILSCMEHRILNNPIIDKAILFFNQYYNLVEHPFTRQDVEKISNLDLAIKLDFLHWIACDPKSKEEVGRFYRYTPFEFFKNLYKNMDIMHYSVMLNDNILPILKKNNFKTVLDYGGGSGYLSILLSMKGYDVTFAEINKLNVEWMKYITKELNLNIKVIDLYEKEIEETYDSIIIKDVVEHLAEPKVVLNKLSQKTKNLLVIPQEMVKEEDYLPMHFCYKFE